jgi:uncharacterized protein with beta-barrel porin domain
VKVNGRKIAYQLCFYALGAIPGAGFSQSAPGPGLIPLSSQYASEVERAAAVANQATFNQLDTGGCNPGGIYNNIPSPTYNPGLTPACTGGEFNVFLNTRELVQTANDIQGAGPTVASLGLAVDGLSRSLRWTAAEEMAAQGSIMNEFNNDQLASLKSRINAVRMGARGFTVGYVPAADWSNAYAANDTMVDGVEGVAAVQAPRETYSRWGGFMDASFGWGKRDPSLQEDAFDFEGTEITAGVDYRFRNSWTFGGIVGYTDQEVDFDEAASDLFVVDGGIETTGISGIGFAVYNGNHLYGDFSLGYQVLDNESDRRIKYPSLNPNLSGVNEQATATSDGEVITATLGFGYSMPIGALTLDPYFSGIYRDSTIDAFEEVQSISLADGGTNNFNLVVADQDFESIETQLGLRFAYVFTPRFGTLIPMAHVAWHSELEDDPRTIRAAYGSLSTVQASEFFNVLTEGRDNSWYSWSVGFSTVIRGGRQATPGGAIRGGLQLWVKYESVEEYEFYDQQLIAGGFRYEF